MRVSSRACLLVVVCGALLCGFVLLCLPAAVLPSSARLSASTLHSDPAFRRDLDANLRHKVLHSAAGLELYVHKAFLDDRFNRSVIRIFALEMKEAVTVAFVCRWRATLAGGERTVEVDARKYFVDRSWPDWSPYFASNFDCAVPPGIPAPASVSLASGDGRFAFTLTVEGAGASRQPRHDLSVCVKPITGHFKVARFIEWIEIQRLAGVEHFIVYISDLAGASRFVFRYYERLGVVSVIDFPYLTAVLQKVDRHGFTDSQRYGIYQQVYLVAMHDCLYRFRRYFRHLAIIDVDEVILPYRNETLPQSLARMRPVYRDAAAYMFRTAWHLEEFSVGSPPRARQPDYTYMLQYAMATPPIDNQPKSVMVTDRVITINFHSVLDVADRRFGNMMVAWDDFGYVHHFRGTCRDKFQDWRCQRMRKTARLDPVISRYEVALKSRVTAVLDHLQVV